MQKQSKAPRKKATSSKRTAAPSRKTPAAKLARTKAVATPAAKAPRVAEAPRAPKQPLGRRAIFIDVENTSSEHALIGALEQLGIDRSEFTTELVAVGNWRVIGQHVARMLAQRGARLVHTAPATGVKDWSDLSIAVNAGIWLGRAGPGDQIEIVSADRAFDAVADAAANLGVKFRRLTYGPLSGLAEAIKPAGDEDAGGPQHRTRRGGRRRRRGGPPIPPPWSPASAPPPQRRAEAARASARPQSSATNGADADPQGATPEQIIATIARLTTRAPERGVNLDLLINALKAEGFGRPTGSPRLVTRLRKMKDVEVSPTGMVRLVSLPPGPLRIEIPVQDAIEAIAPAEEAAAKAAPKQPRRRGSRGGRGGRGRRPKAAEGSETTSESSA